MKHLLFIFALSGMLFQNISRVIILVNYELNREYISKNLCENRDKPALHCNGQCHLKKQLDREEKNEGTPSRDLKERTEVQFCENAFSLSFMPHVSGILLNTDIQFSIPSAHGPSIFQPPRC